METRRSSAGGRITIHDMAGAQVKEVVFSERNSANLTGLPCGTYTIRFMSSDGNMMSNQLVILRP